MSARLFADDVLFFQRLLRAEGLYLADLDGDWGPKTEEAAQTFDAASLAIRQETRAFDIRSESNITTLSLKTQRLARVLLGRILDGGVNARIISGSRTYAQQDALFRKGRFGNPGPRVTNARGGQSNHNFGIAWDIGVFTASGGFVTSEAPYEEAAALGLTDATLAIEWGGNWISFVDRPHYQLAVGMSIAELRTSFEAGQLGTAFA
jgi:peptidoglycan L-alanyl-D-glutamate endopeptidase CwlK